MKERRKIFSTPPRRKLFCGDQEETCVVCRDCGYVFNTKGTTDIACPKCGGTRFNVVNKPVTPEQEPEHVKNFSRRSLFEEEFQKDFSETSDPLEIKLKKFSGKSLSLDEFNSNFGKYTTLDDLKEKGFAEVENEKVKISNDAFIQSRLFSKITISITKTLELDPDVCMANEEHKRDIIEGLENRGSLTPKCIMILKKTHGIPITKNEDWEHDSGIVNDIPLEFGGQSKSLPEFKRTLEERYPDAPEDPLDILRRRGIIDIYGDNVKIN